MKHRGKIVLIFLVTIILLIISISVNYLIRHNKNKMELQFLSSVIEKINGQGKALLYLTDKKEQCSYCENANLIVDYYSQNYDLDIIYVDKSKISEESYSKLSEKYKFKDFDIMLPATIFFAEGKVQAVANEMVDEIIFRQFLIDYGFLEQKYSYKDAQISLEEYEARKDDDEIYVYFVMNMADITSRKQILNLANKYNFNYNILYYGFSNSQLIISELEENDDILIDSKSLLIVQNGKIVDYAKIENQNEAKDFLEKNNIIE